MMSRDMSAGEFRRSKKKQHETALGFFITVLSVKCRGEARCRGSPRGTGREAVPQSVRGGGIALICLLFSSVLTRKAAASLPPERVCDGIAAHMNLRYGLKDRAF